MIFLNGCQSNPSVVYETRYLSPPEVYISPCPRDFEDETIQSVIVGLDKTVRCYEGKQESLRDWFTKNEQLNKEDN